MAVSRGLALGDSRHEDMGNGFIKTPKVRWNFHRGAPASEPSEEWGRVIKQTYGIDIYMLSYRFTI
jgi:hypothetical protein